MVLDPAREFRNYLAEKHSSSVLIEEDYLVLHFKTPNGLPELVNDISLYLFLRLPTFEKPPPKLAFESPQPQYRSYQKMVDRAVSDQPYLSQAMQAVKDEKGWRYTFTGLDKKIKDVDPSDLIAERRRAPTKEELERAQLKLLARQEAMEKEEEERRMKAK